MPRALKAYVRIVEAVNYRIGRVAMYLLFAMMVVLLISSGSKVLFEAWPSIAETFFSEEAREAVMKQRVTPPLWTLEMAQFLMVAYYMLGGPYSLQLGSNVRMDLLYGGWSDRRKAWFDAFTVLALMFYLGVLLYGGISSTSYAIEFGERAPGAWRPQMWPIKLIMTIAVFLMLLQAIAIFLKDLAKIRGEEI